MLSSRSAISTCRRRLTRTPGNEFTTELWSSQPRHISKPSTGDPFPPERDRREQGRAVYTMPIPRIALVVIALLSVGCALLSGSREQYFVCSYDRVWDA